MSVVAGVQGSVVVVVELDVVVEVDVVVEMLVVSIRFDFMLVLFDCSEVLDVVASPWLDVVHGGCHHCAQAVIGQERFKENRQLCCLYQLFRTIVQDWVKSHSKAQIFLRDPEVTIIFEVQLSCCSGDHFRNLAFV